MNSVMNASGALRRLASTAVDDVMQCRCLMCVILTLFQVVQGVYCQPLNDSSGGSTPTPFGVSGCVPSMCTLRHTHGCSMFMADKLELIYCNIVYVILSIVLECCQEKYSFSFISEKGRFFFTARLLYGYMILPRGIEKRTFFQSSYWSHGW